MAFEHGHDLALKGIELARTFGAFPWNETRLRDPLFNGFRVQFKFLSNLGSLESLLLMERMNLAKEGIADHWPPPCMMRLRMSAAD